MNIPLADGTVIEIKGNHLLRIEIFDDGGVRGQLIDWSSRSEVELEHFWNRGFVGTALARAIGNVLRRPKGAPER